MSRQLARKAKAYAAELAPIAHFSSMDACMLQQNLLSRKQFFAMVALKSEQFEVTDFNMTLEIAPLGIDSSASVGHTVVQSDDA